jgi:O-antigen/teichoic acid export membrane protein
LRPISSGDSRSGKLAHVTKTPEPPEVAGEGTARTSMTARVIRGAGLTSGGYLFAQVLNLGVYVVLSRLLDPVDFGRYASATVLIAFGVLFTESGMQAAIVHRRDRLDEAMSTAAAATLIGGILLSLCALAIAPILGAIFNDSQVTLLAAAASGLIFVNTLAVVPNAILQRRFSSVRLTVVDPLEVVAFGLVSIALAAHGSGPWALVIGQYAAFVTSTSLVWVFARWRPRVRLMSYGMWRELASYSRHVLVSTAISRFGGQMADTVIVGRSLGPASLGQFRYALRIAMLPWSVAQTGAGYVLFPALARISADAQRLQAAFLRSLRWMVAIGFPAGLLLVPLGPPLTVLVFGRIWLPAGHAAVAMSACAGGAAITATVAELLKAHGNPAPLIRINLVSAIVSALAVLALVPFGLSAAAAGLSIGALAGGAYALRIVLGDLDVSLASIRREIWPPIVSATAMALALLPLDRLVLRPASHGLVVGLILVAVEGVLCVLLYAALLAVLAPRYVREAKEIARRRHRPDESPEPAS